jgi:rfaE bifunctional protein kinase chain/domain
MMTTDRLNELISRYAGRRIAVVGDFFLDKYLEFDPALAETSLETGKTANQVVSVRHSPGAAGTVVSNLAALGCTVIPIGFTGDDGEGYELRQDLVRLGCATDHLLCVPERCTPTYLKPMDASVPGIAGEQGRYDTKNRRPLPSQVEHRTLAALEEVLPLVDGVIVADQVEEPECGVVTSGFRSKLAELAAAFPDTVFWADSRRRIGLFTGVIVKPNQFEAVATVFPDHEGVISRELLLTAGEALRNRSGRPVFVTRAEHGMLVFDEGGCAEVPGVPVGGEIDPTGAGDSATAAAVLTLASGGTSVEAALVANLVASITIQHLGVTGTASPAQLPVRLMQWHDENAEVGETTRQGAPQ